MALDIEIHLSQYDHNGADFICRITGRKFELGNEPGLYGGVVFYEDDVDDPIMRFGRNYKSKRSTRIAKILEWFEDREEFHGGLVAVRAKKK